MEQPAPPVSVHVKARATARFTFEVTTTRPPDQAIELFTPEGERTWADGWNPIYANIRTSYEVGTGTVFTTEAHSVRRVWVVDQYDLQTGIVRYTVFTPDQSITRIEVRVSPAPAGSIARVSYDRTALNAHADADVKHFSMHARMMQSEWQSALNAIRKR